MQPQPQSNKKWTIIYTLAVTLLLASTFVLTFPLDTKLRFFCAIDDAHVAKDPPTSNSGDYWINPNTGTKLVVITVLVAIDTGMWLYYDNTENIFWIGAHTGPMKSTFYGPYPGTLWTLTSLMNPLAIAGIALSIIALIYQPIRKLWTKTHTANIPIT
jgi:hypothetical protein